MHNSILAAAISDALSLMEKQREISLDDLIQLAQLAQKVNEEALTFLAELPPVKTEREYLSLQLLRAAFDLGRGLLFLVSSNPMDMSGPALALHRSQIENFLRGAYLGFIADDNQVQDFYDSDLGIREKNQSDKWQPIGPIRLAKFVEKLIDELAGENSGPNESSLSLMVKNAWSPLCGMVHGGRAVHALYTDGQGQIGSNIPLPIMIQAVCNCYAITNFGFLLLIVKVYNLAGVPKNSPLSNASEEFYLVHRKLNGT